MTFRFARHTNDLEKIKSFYVNILGLEVLGGFENHDGYDGIFLGKPSENWHLEFTKSAETAVHTFDDDDLLVFYPNTKLEFEVILENVKKHGVPFIDAKNPYWKNLANTEGKMFMDPDGYRIVVTNLKMGE